MVENQIEWRMRIYMIVEHDFLINVVDPNILILNLLSSSYDSIPYTYISMSYFCSIVILGCLFHL